MENKYNVEVIELTSEEIEKVSGGWNLFEYIASGIGYVAGAFSDPNPSPVNYDNQSDFVHNSGGNKW